MCLIFISHLDVDSHHLKDHLHCRAADDARLLLVEALEALLQSLDLVQVQPCALLSKQM